MLGILVDQKVFEVLLIERYPKLVEHMRKYNYLLDLICLEWLVTLFLNSLNPETELFVLTAFLLKGQKIIIKIALLIIDCLKDDVMKATAFDQIYFIIAKNPSTVIEPSMLCKRLRDSKKHKVTNSMLNGIR